jgi:hypothetical protein
LELLEERHLPSVSLGPSFDGLSSVGSGSPSPPDTVGAAGPNSFIEAVNTAMGIYNKATGARTDRVELGTFFNAGLGGVLSLSDPVVIYDEIDSRFFLGILDYSLDRTNQQSRLDVATSNGSNPTIGTQDWTFRRYNVNDGDREFHFADYPKIGYNADGYVVGLNMYNSSRQFLHVTTLSIRKSDRTGFLNVVPGAGHFTFAPATMHAAAPGAPMWFVEDGHEGGGGDTVNVVRMTDPFSNAPAYATTSLNVNWYDSAPSPRQPGGSLGDRTSLGTRFYFSALRNVGGQTRLVSAHAVGSGGGVRARWYEFNVGGASPTLTQEGEITQGAGVDTFFPTIDIAPSGALGMTFSETSGSAPGGYLSMYVTARTPGDDLSTMQPPVLAIQGTAFLNSGGRAGDYSFASIDPVDGTFWAANEYASPGDAPNWRTWIANFDSSLRVTHFGVRAPSQATAGATFNVTVAALNPYNNVVPGYLGSVQLTSSDPQVPVLGQHTFTAGDRGVCTFAVSLRSAGSRSVTATATINPSITGTSDPITVAPDVASTLIISDVPPVLPAGVPNDITVTARDRFGNTATGYQATVHFASMDGAATLPAEYTFTGPDNGRHLFSNGLTLRTPGTWVVSVTDTAAPPLTGAVAITIPPEVAASLSLDVPYFSSAGAPGTLTVTAWDRSGRVAPAYRGTVHFSCTDAAATLPADYTYTALDAGTHTFSDGATLRTAGAKSITATDTWDQRLTVTSRVVVNPGQPATFRFDELSPTLTAGEASDLTLVALDGYGNVAPSFRGTVHFTSSDPAARLPADYTFQDYDQGVHTWVHGLTLFTAGHPTLTATDIGLDGISHVVYLTVIPAPASTLTVNAPGSLPAGAPFDVAVSARDRYGNLATGYTGTVRFTSSDDEAVLPDDYTFTPEDDGAHTFPGVTLFMAGDQNLLVTDSGSAISGGSTLTVSLGPGGAAPSPRLPGVLPGVPSVFSDEGALLPSRRGCPKTGPALAGGPTPRLPAAAAATTRVAPPPLVLTSVDRFVAANRGKSRAAVLPALRPDAADDIWQDLWYLRPECPLLVPE